MRAGRRGAAYGAAILALSLGGASTALAKHGRHHRHRATERVLVEQPAAAPSVPYVLTDRGAAYSSGFAFGLFDLGISGTSTGLSPYAGLAYGYVGLGYDGPGYGVPGY